MIKSKNYVLTDEMSVRLYHDSGQCQCNVKLFQCQKFCDYRCLICHQLPMAICLFGATFLTVNLSVKNLPTLNKS